MARNKAEDLGRYKDIRVEVCSVKPRRDLAGVVILLKPINNFTLWLERRRLSRKREKKDCLRPADEELSKFCLVMNDK